MTDLADADLRGPAAGASAWPSPSGSTPVSVLPPPHAETATPIDMPPPLTHEPVRSATPVDTTSAPVTTELPVVEAVIGAEPPDEPEPQPEPQPAIITGPAAILSPTPAVAPVDTAAISLPEVAAARPPAKLSHESLIAPEQLELGPKKKGKSAGSRILKLLVVIAVIGGLGYAGATYGPGLYDDYVGEDEPAEPAAPMAFPRARTTAPEVRTATFVLEGLATGSEASYTVTVDFETRVSRVVIDRTEAPDLEVLTFSDDALVRRLDSSTWYQIERGAFPLDDQLQRTDWIRMIDELVPPERRAGVVIDDSTVAEVAGIDTRHLVLTLDPALLELVNTTGESLDPIGDIAEAAASADEPTDEATGEPAPLPAADEPRAPESTTDVQSAPSTPRTPLVETVPVAGEPVGPNAIQVELWIDAQGVVRRSVGADILGANSITILETTPEDWVPDYPDVEQVMPMTAAALIELGF